MVVLYPGSSARLSYTTFVDANLATGRDASLAARHAA